jgi:hypothetical protein
LCKTCSRIVTMPNPKRVLYVAQPMNLHKTPLQRQMFDYIKSTFPDWKIENPDQPHHNEGFRHYLDTRNNPMAYFEEVILPKIDGCVGLRFQDGMIAAGVAFEMFRSSAKGLPLWFLDYSKSSGFLLTPQSRFPANVISVKDTYERILRQFSD